MKRTIILASVFAVFGLFTNTLSAQEASAASLYNDGLAKLKAKEYDGSMELMEQALAAADSSSETDIKVMKLAKKNGAFASYYVGTKVRKEKDFKQALEIFRSTRPGKWCEKIAMLRATLYEQRLVEMSE